MTRILAVIPLPWDATSYYRSYGVFNDLKQQLGGELEIDAYGGRKYTWAELCGYDILFLQRPGNPELLKLIKYCKELGIKVWIDYDDNLFELPVYNRVHDEYTPEVKKAMIEMLLLADAITVSTEALKQSFHRVKVESIVIPNALNEQMTPMAKEYNFAAAQQFVWRGSDTHMGDLYFHQSELIEAITNRPNTLWQFVGYNPWQITLFCDQAKVRYQKPEDIFVYYAKLRAMKAQVMHVPLYDDSFNRCKSNIAWIEATAAGMITIGPNWPEWQKPGVITYDSIEDYGSKLVSHIENPGQYWQQSRDYIMNNLTLKEVNKKRVQVITSLTIRKQIEPLPQTMIE